MQLEREKEGLMKEEEFIEIIFAIYFTVLGYRGMRKKLSLS
jgi:hypothetical protein